MSQNFGRTYREALGEHHDTVQNGCETLWVSAFRGSGYVWPGKLKRLLLPSGVRRWMRNIQMECRRRRIPDVRHSGGMSAEQNSGCESSAWNVRCHTSQGGRLRVQGVGTPPLDDTERASLSRATPSRFPKRTRGALPYPDIFCHGFQRTLLNLGLLWW